MALLVAHLVTLAWDRPRPYVADPGDSHLFIARSHDPSFPSDHTTAAFAIAVSIFLRSRRIGLLALAMALTLALARVAVGVHYPGDVAGGALIGTAAALLLWMPPVRGPRHALADWMGGVYERMASRCYARPRHSPPWHRWGSRSQVRILSAPFTGEAES